MDLGLDGIAGVIAALINGLYNQSSQAINGLCRLVWTDVFPYVVGLVLGYHIVLMILEDDLTDGFKKIFIALFPMLIVAWLIRPGDDGCNVVKIKDQALEARVLVTNAIAPEMSGGGPEALVSNTFNSIMYSMNDLIGGLGDKFVIDAFSTGEDKK